jgi:hypothetical protein
MDLALILVLLVIAGAILLVIAYIWYFIIQRSPLRLVNLFVRTALDKGSVNPDAPIEKRQEEFISDALTANTEALKHQQLGVLEEVRREVPKMPLPPEDHLHSPDETTSDSGWPVKLNEKEDGNPRAFLQAKYRTDHEEQ